MVIKLNANNTGNTFSPIKEGEYEVFPTVFDTSVSSTGNEMVTFNYVIREDVEQEEQGREIRFDRFVFTEKAEWRINQASKAADMDMDQEFETTTDWANAFKGQALRVVVKHEEVNGKTYPKIVSFKPSEHIPEPTMDIDDSDVPF